MPEKDFGLNDFIPDRKKTFISNEEWEEIQDIRRAGELDEFPPELIEKMEKKAEESQETLDDIAERF